MKRLISFFACLILIMAAAHAQSKTCIAKYVNEKYDIKDKVIVRNLSTVTIDRIVVVKVEEGKQTLLGKCDVLRPKEKYTLQDNENDTKKLKGCVVQLCVKGRVYNNGKEEVTYDFDADLTEDSHDLYINIMYKGIESGSVLDI